MNEIDPFKFFEDAADFVEQECLQDSYVKVKPDEIELDMTGVVVDGVSKKRRDSEDLDMSEEPFDPFDGDTGGRSVHIQTADDITAYSAEDIDGHSNTSYWNTGSVNYYQPSTINEERNRAINQVDIMLLSLPDAHQMIDKISLLTSSMDNVISKLSRYGENKHQQLLGSCKEIKSNLQERGKLIGHLDKAKRDSTEEKIQWLGQLNVLSTLFYHLLRGQDGGEPYIKAPVEVVKRMLANNFIDKDGHDISMETLKTYFTPGKTDKKAKEGDRIELPNKKTKK